MDTKYEHTEETRRLLSRTNELQDAKELISKHFGTVFGKKIDVKALLEVIEQYADSKARLWSAAYKVYPQLRYRADAYANFTGFFLPDLANGSNAKDERSESPSHPTTL